MSKSCRTVEEVKLAIQTNGLKDQVQFYDSWAENYDEAMSLMSYRAPTLAVNFLSENFSGSPEDALVLDIACGSGLVAKVMAELGFRHFVGVDASKGMLEQAAKTGLYQDLRLAVLGPEPLPARTGAFDVVILVGGLDVGFAPVSVVREVCHAAKPGGFVCMARGTHTGTPAHKYKQELERELQLMEEEGLWSLIATKHVDRYMEDPHVSSETGRDMQEERFISGTFYLYKKSISPSI